MFYLLELLRSKYVALEVAEVLQDQKKRAMKEGTIRTED